MTNRKMGGRSTTNNTDQVLVQLATLRRLYHHVSNGGQWDPIDTIRLSAAIATIERQKEQIDKLSTSIKEQIDKLSTSICS